MRGGREACPRVGVEEVTRMSCADNLVAGEGVLWATLAAHPFVVAVRDGTLPAAAFDRWLVADHVFVVGYRRFLAQVVAAAPDEPARDLLAGSLAALQGELDLFRSQAAARGLDLGAEPGLVALGYTGGCTPAFSRGSRSRSRCCTAWSEPTSTPGGRCGTKRIATGRTGRSSTGGRRRSSAVGSTRSPCCWTGSPRRARRVSSGPCSGGSPGSSWRSGTRCGRRDLSDRVNGPVQTLRLAAPVRPSRWSAGPRPPR